MRIPLADEDRSRRRRRRRRTRSYDSAVTMPQAPGMRRRAAQRDKAPDHGPASSKGQGRQGRAERRRAGRRPAAAAQAPAAAVRTRSWPRRLPALLLVGMLVAGGVLASTDARFFVYEGHIIGARYLAAEAIYQAAAVHEQNIFWIDPGAVARRIAQIDGIKSARVHCDLPAVVTIEVEERQPLILWRVLAQGRDWWLDEEGVVLPYHGDTRSPQTVFVVDSSSQELAVGQKLGPEGTVQSVIKLAQAVPDTRVFFYEGGRGLSFTQEVEGAKWPVYVGSSDDLERKIQVMQALTAYLKANSIRPRYIDVRWAAHPVYGRAAAETTTGGGQ